MKNLFRIPKLIGTCILLSLPAQGEVLWITTFSASPADDGTNRNLTNTIVASSFTDILTADDANLTFEDSTFTGTVFMNVGTMASGTYYSPRTNVGDPTPATPQNGGWWQSEFRYTGGSQTIELSSIVLDMVRSSAVGNIEIGDSNTGRDITLTLEYSLDSGGLWTNVAAPQTYETTVASPATAEEQHQDRTFTFESPLSVNLGTQDLWLRVKAENFGEERGTYVNIRDITFNDTAIPEPSGAPLITSFENVGANLWEVGLSGAANGSFVFRSSEDLSFSPGSLLENLTQGDPGDPGDPGTISGTNDSILTLDEFGVGLVRVTLTGATRDFLRAETAPE